MAEETTNEVKKVVDAARAGVTAMKAAHTEPTMDEKILHELKALNSKMSWFVFLSIISILAALFF
jgi:hypothetical protein